MKINSNQYQSIINDNQLIETLFTIFHSIQSLWEGRGEWNGKMTKLMIFALANQPPTMVPSQRKKFLSFAEKKVNLNGDFQRVSPQFPRNWFEFLSSIVSIVTRTRELLNLFIFVSVYKTALASRRSLFSSFRRILLVYTRSLAWCTVEGPPISSIITRESVDSSHRCCRKAPPIENEREQ